MNDLTNDASVPNVLNTRTPNILNAIPTYNHANIESTISDLKRELKEQKEVNNMLKGDKFDKKSEDIIAFVNRNEGEINDQLNRLSEIITELKIVVIENDNLEQNEEQFNLLIETPECVRVADKLLKIKALKNDVALFLDNAGVTPRPTL